MTLSHSSLLLKNIIMLLVEGCGLVSFFVLWLELTTSLDSNISHFPSLPYHLLFSFQRSSQLFQQELRHTLLSSSGCFLCTALVCLLLSGSLHLMKGAACDGFVYCGLLRAFTCVSFTLLADCCLGFFSSSQGSFPFCIYSGSFGFFLTLVRFFICQLQYLACLIDSSIKQFTCVLNHGG